MPYTKPTHCWIKFSFWVVLLIDDFIFPAHKFIYLDFLSGLSPLAFQASTLTYFSTKKSTCPTQSFSCPKFFLKITKTREQLSRAPTQRAHREKWETTKRNGETSGRSQLRLIETLFHDPSDVTLPKFSK